MSLNNAHYWSVRVILMFTKLTIIWVLYWWKYKIFKIFSDVLCHIFVLCVNILIIIVVALTLYPLHSLPVFIISNYTYEFSQINIESDISMYLHVEWSFNAFWWAEGVAFALASFRNLRTSRSGDKTCRSHISQQSDREVAIVMSLLFCLHFFS